MELYYGGMAKFIVHAFCTTGTNIIRLQYSFNYECPVISKKLHIQRLYSTANKKWHYTNSLTIEYFSIETECIFNENKNSLLKNHSFVAPNTSCVSSATKTPSRDLHSASACCHLYACFSLMK